MAIEFRGVRFPPLRDLTVSAPSGAVIGIVGEKGAGKGRCCAWHREPSSPRRER
jgi:ABC-type polysaccharide/polyol phosphate transport system ATPase subunit